MEVRSSLAHNFSLLSALASHRLTHGDLARMRRRSETYGMRSAWMPCGVFRLFYNSSMLFVTREDLRFEDVTGAFELPQFNCIGLQDSGVAQAKRTELQTKKTFVEERISKAKEQLFHSSKPAARNSGSDRTWSSDLVVLGFLTPEEKHDLSAEAFDDTPGSSKNLDRPTILFEWISEDINHCIKLTGIPPPIVSRCYQELSNGMLGFNQAIKVADVPFPFPFSQLLEILLIVFTAVVPLYVAKFTRGLVMTPVLTLGITLALWSLSEISRELENPFADGPNQLPVIDMHERFVEVLRTVYRLPRHRGARKKEPEEDAPTSVNGVRFELADAPTNGIEVAQERTQVAQEVASFSELKASGRRPGSLCL